MLERSDRYAEHTCSLCVRRRIGRVTCDAQSTRTKESRRSTQSTAECAQYAPETTQTDSLIPCAVWTVMPNEEKIY